MKLQPQLSPGTAAVLLSLAATAASQCDVTWLYPINGLLINYNDTVVASWTSSCEKPVMLVWGPNPANSAQVLWHQDPVAENGTYQYSFPLAQIGTFSAWPFPAHFQLEYNATADDAGADGYTFSVTSTAGPATTYALSSTVTQVLTTPTVTSTIASNLASSSRSSQAPSTATPSATNTPAAVVTSQSSGLSTGAKAGIGVGVALGVIIVITAVVWGLMSRKKLRQHQRAMEADKRYTPAEQVALAQGSDTKWRSRELQSQLSRHEMSSDLPPQELDSQGVVSPLLSSKSSYVPMHGSETYSQR